jgi:membrane protease YdiL (CAAX protease family)
LTPNPSGPSGQRVDALLLTGLFALLAFQLLAVVRSGPIEQVAAPKVALADVRRIEERGIVLDGSASMPEATRDAIDPGGRATTPRAVLDDARDALVRRPGTPAALHVVWTAVAVALSEDRLALEALGDLVKDPETLREHGARLDDLNRLARGQPAADLAGLNGWLNDLGATAWLPRRLEARHLANAGEASGAEAATTDARALASGFVGRQLMVIGTQFALMLLGLMTLVLFPLMLRRRLLHRRLGGLDGASSPFRLDRTSRVLIGWLFFTQLMQLGLSQLLLALGSGGVAMAAVQAVGSALNGAIAIALIVVWGRPEGAPPLLESLRLRPKDASGGWRGITLWALPAIGVGVVALQIAALVSAFLFGPPQSFQQSIVLLMESANPVSLALIAIGAVVLAPVIEEVLFRGFLYRNLRDMMSRPLALALSGMVFGLVHFHGDYILPLAGLGVALALVYEWSGSLWVPIIAHAAWNGLTLVQVHVTFHL